MQLGVFRRLFIYAGTYITDSGDIDEKSNLLLFAANPIQDTELFGMTTANRISWQTR